MKPLSKTLALALAVAITLACGAIHGRLDHRWGPSPDLRAAAERLVDLPEQFGDWKLQSSVTMSPDVIEMLQCESHVSRVYRNERTGERVHVAVLLGPPGPIAVHTPEICYSSRDYHQQEARRRLNIPDRSGASDAFWALTFRAESLRADSLRVCYAWSEGSRWVASERPRFEFAGRPYLYKIQLAALLPPWAKSETQDPCRRFLADFLPAARPYIDEPFTE
jgi:hypothetical protein